MIKNWAITLLLLFWVLNPVTSLNAAEMDDFRVVIDVSGSMVKNDPNNLRIPAMRMINGLIPTGAQAGVWTFGRYVNMEVKWGKVNQQWRKQADLGASKIHSRGQFTNIESALTRSTTGWKKLDPKTERNLILLTDGQVDISKKAEKNAQSRENILNNVIPDLAKKGIKVHAIALSRDSDELLLKRLARQTKGSFEIANSADDLQRIFLRMFERATKPDTVPFKGNKFTIDKSIKEMTLLVFRKGKKATRLIQPDKKVHTLMKNSKNVNWRKDKGYDLITVSKPQPGDWTLDAEMDKDNRVMIVTDLKLEVDELPAFITPDQLLDVSVELHNQNKKISKKSFLKFVDFKLEHKTGKNIKELKLELKKSHELKDKGIYQYNFSEPLEEGSHELLINADSRTFSRSKRFTVQVQWPVIVDIGKTDQAGSYGLQLTPRDEYINPKTLSMIARMRLPDGSKQLIDLKQESGRWVGVINANEQDGLHKLLINLQAKTVDGKAITHELETYSVLGIKQEKKKLPVAPIVEQPASDNGGQAKTSEAAKIEVVDEQAEEESESSWTSTIIIISAINLVLILIGGAVFLYMRKRNKSDDLDLMADDEDIDSEDEDLFRD